MVIFLNRYYSLILWMAQRITIMLDDKLAFKVRKKQAELIKESKRSVSFSRVVNQVLEKGFNWKNQWIFRKPLQDIGLSNKKTIYLETLFDNAYKSWPIEPSLIIILVQNLNLRKSPDCFQMYLVLIWTFSYIHVQTSFGRFWSRF